MTTHCLRLSAEVPMLFPVGWRLLERAADGSNLPFSVSAVKPNGRYPHSHQSLSRSPSRLYTMGPWNTDLEFHEDRVGYAPASCPVAMIAVDVAGAPQLPCGQGGWRDSGELRAPAPRRSTRSTKGILHPYHQRSRPTPVDLDVGAAHPQKPVHGCGAPSERGLRPARPEYLTRSLPQYSSQRVPPETEG
jgi:hypothetical protein